MLFVFYFSSHGDISLRVNKDREKGIRGRETNRHTGVLLTSHIHWDYKNEKL